MNIGGAGKKPLRRKMLLRRSRTILDDMKLDRAEKELEPTRTVPVLNDAPGAEGAAAPAEEKAGEQQEEEARPARRRRRTDRYEEEEAARAASAAYTARPVFQAESATAREVASRIRTLNGEMKGEPLPEPGSRVPPQAARMSAAARVRMAGQQENARKASGTERVGYAPGRMNEGDARMAARSRMEAARQVGAGTAQRPQRPPYAGRPVVEETRPRRRGWIAPCCILLVLALLCGALYLIPADAPGFAGEIKRTVSGWIPFLGGGAKEASSGVTGMIASGYENVVAPTDVGFTITTSRDITDLRLTDADGEVLMTGREFVNNTDQTIWNLTWHLEEGYEGEIRLQVLRGEAWEDTEYTVAVNVASLPEVATETPAVTVTETPQPVVTVTEAPTEVPTQAPETEAPRAEEDAAAMARTDETEALPDAEGGEAEEYLPEAEDAEAEGEGEAPFADGEELPEEGQDGEAAADDGEGAEEAATYIPASTPEPTATPLPEPTATPKLTAKAGDMADPSLVSTQIIYNGTKRASEYTRASKEQITMPVGGEYTRQQMGVLTFRNDAFRQNAACGTVKNAASLEVAWTAEAGSIKGASQTYYGIGWVGQPAIVKWSKEVRELSDIYDGKKEKTGLKEVIVAGLDGTIYFLDLSDGTNTRNIIRLGYPMKGSPSVHPGGAPYMNVGQFARKMAKGTGKIGLRQYNLYTGKEMNLIDGLDGSNRRAFNNVGSFETSALMDRTSDSLITAGTNGMLYVINMGSTFDYQMGTYTQSPGTVLLKTKAKGESDADTAVEASIAMYDRYVFYADVGGILRCVDTNNMKVVWAVDTEDTVESTPALALNGEDGLDLYTANILSKRKKGDAQVRCFDAMTGDEKWKVSFGVKKDTKTKTVAGFRASPVVGQNELSGLIYYTVNNLSEEGAEALGLSEEKAAIVALDSRTGNLVWTKGLNGPAYSSPVAVYSEAGQGWIIQCDGDGSILLMDGQSGKTLHTLTVEGAIEGSPAVYGNMMVVGTTQRGANMIYGIRITEE